MCITLYDDRIKIIGKKEAYISFSTTTKKFNSVIFLCLKPVCYQGIGLNKPETYNTIFIIIIICLLCHIGHHFFLSSSHIQIKFCSIFHLIVPKNALLISLSYHLNLSNSILKFSILLLFLI